MKTRFLQRILFLLAALPFLTVMACGGGGGDDNGGGGGVPPPPAVVITDADGDGILDVNDAFPNDPIRFAAFTRVGLTGSHFVAGVALNNAAPVVTVVGMRDSPGALNASYWEVDTAIPLPSIAATSLDHLSAVDTFSAAYDVNNAGDKVGESAANATDFVAVIWPTGTIVPTQLGEVVVGNNSAAYSINNNGMIVGEGEDVLNFARAVIWPTSLDAPVLLTDTLASTTSSAYKINDNGVILGEATTGGSAHAVAWVVDPLTGAQTNFIDLGTAAGLGGVRAIALGFNGTNTYVGEYEDINGNAKAVEWTVDAIGTVTAVTDLGSAAATQSSAASISGDVDTRTVGWTMIGGTMRS